MDRFSHRRWRPGIPLEQIDVDPRDKPSLQRGLATFMQYCAGCHSTEYQRFERTATDLEIPVKLFEGICCLLVKDR